MERVVQFLKAHAGGLPLLIGIGTFLAILGPYNTTGLGWPWVWLYWTGLIVFGGLCGNAIAAIVDRLAPGLPDWASYAVIALTVSVPVSAAVIAIQAAVGPLPPLIAWPVIYGFVLVISIAVSGVSFLLARRRGGAPAAGPGRALTDKLPAGLRTAALLALQSEDHYLRVHTARGEALILMRLSDAMAAAEALDGAQTHRSWWVARAAIAAAEKSGGRAALTLSNGLTVPVSRKFYPALRERGWI